MMGLQFSAGDLIAVVALVIAVWSAIRTDRFNKRQAAFEETNERLNLMLIEKEAAESEAQKRADMSANFYQSGKSSYRLKVFNRGHGTARNVRFETLHDGPILSEGDIKRKFPIPLLEQHQSVELIGRVYIGAPSRAHIKLIWDDDTGTNHSKELHPSW